MEVGTGAVPSRRWAARRVPDDTRAPPPLPPPPPGVQADRELLSRNLSILVLLIMLASVSRTARLGDQLQLDDGSNSKIADGYATGSSARRGVAVGDLPTSSLSGHAQAPS
eukprot:scaffold21039_cov24-Phaeocystis_antarctica.AAC.1